MARVREFNEQMALDKAIEIFWRKGYANTSMREMVKHTGVAHAGLYTAFGGKDDLFQAALEKYEKRIFMYLFSGLESERASLREIKKFFDFVKSSTSDKYFRNGCFIANSATEYGKSEGPIFDVLSRTFERQIQAFTHALSNAKNLNQVSANINVETTAASLVVLFYGSSTLIRMKAPQSAIDAAIDSNLAALQA